MSLSSSPTGADVVTERLVLRLWPPADIAAVVGGLRLAHWARDFPSAADRRISGFVAERPEAMYVYGQRQIVERDTGLAVGAIGLFWPPDDGVIEVGYGIVESRRGRGYATEATRAMTAFGLTAPGVDEVFADVELANVASVRVLEKAGLRRVRCDGTTATYTARRR
ncbi:Protein N-acetyltransferase, RimJ/RimL family [Nonomuraea maritima]|uniref:Protein N-acetyltransferase, RimJ/RimL family n=1 Tax=Nonomuraea maritima TaxID=683260 RepID=A0A1G9P345_9ACTN|nr:GNAT family N-acetyltransferase [Nonomuraea maritima]SDL93120.1 Protein N-acetyltransferase, RimJ/RimL family [Nonomuraea maritima]